MRDCRRTLKGRFVFPVPAPGEPLTEAVFPDPGSTVNSVEISFSVKSCKDLSLQGVKQIAKRGNRLIRLVPAFYFTEDRPRGCGDGLHILY